MKKRNLFLSLMALLFSLSPVRGQENLVVNVWDGVPADGKPQARLHVFLPEKGAKPARSVLILPGGGYVHLALGHEGTDWAGFFCPRGVAAFVLEYRMPAGQCDVPLADVRRALQTIRSRAAEWGVDSLQVGVMGSSAGGHLAATAAE